MITVYVNKLHIYYTYLHYQWFKLPRVKGEIDFCSSYQKVQVTEGSSYWESTALVSFTYHQALHNEHHSPMTTLVTIYSAKDNEQFSSERF